MKTQDVQDVKDEPAPQPPQPARAAAASKVALDDRPYEYAELLAARSALVTSEVLRQLSDGRAFVRANAALALAALGHTGPDLAPFLRDGDVYVGVAAGEALIQLGLAQRLHLAAIAAALDGARPEVVAKVQRFFAELVGKADAELIAVLDTGKEVVANAIVAACGHVGLRGLQLLQRAVRDERVRVRINAVRGVALLGEIEQASSFDVLIGIERDDAASDVRAAARTAIALLGVRCRAVVAARYKTSEPAPPAVPELERRALTAAELKAAADVAPLDELLRALNAPRAHARINAARALALRGAAAATTSRAVAVLLRDEEEAVRVEAAQALGKLGPSAVIAAPALARALGDPDPAVIAAAEAALADLGEAAAPALIDGLDAPSEPHGARVAALLGKLANGPRLLGDALASPSVDVQVHAALGLGALGKPRAAGELRALSLAAATSGNARVRAAAAKAVEMIEPRPVRAAPKLAIDGFEDRVLGEPELAKAKPALTAAGVAGLALHLSDGRAAVRANAALALGTLGGDAAAAVDALAVCLRDDADAVRLAAARAIERIGDAAIAARAQDLVAALRVPDPALAAQIASMLRARALPAIDEALGRGLDTTDARHAERICELLCARPAGPELLYDAFAHPATQANAARGLAMLGKEKIGRGRALLEAARADSSLQVRELARIALRAFEDPPAAPQIPAIANFEDAVLEPSAFTGAKLDAAQLASFLQDGRPIVRANTATALGTLGAAAAPLIPTIAVQLRDDDARARIAAARALDKLGDDAVIAAAPFLVGALAGDGRVAEVVKAVLAPRKARVEDALIAGLETSDETHGMRIAQLICELPNARELLFIAFDSPAQNVQINAALGIGLLGAVRAGPAGRRRLVNGLAGPFTRRRAAMVKALEMLGDAPA